MNGPPGVFLHRSVHSFRPTDWGWPIGMIGQSFSVKGARASTKPKTMNEYKKTKLCSFSSKPDPAFTVTLCKKNWYMFHCFWEPSLYLSTIICTNPIFPTTYTNEFLQNMGSIGHGRAKGQVSSTASAHLKQPHKTLGHIRQLSFDEVFNNIFKQHLFARK